MKRQSLDTKNDEWQRYECVVILEKGKGRHAMSVMSKIPLVKGSIILTKTIKWVVVVAIPDGTRPELGDVVNMSKK